MNDNNINNQPVEPVQQTVTPESTVQPEQTVGNPLSPQLDATRTDAPTSNDILYAVISYIGFLSLIVLYAIKPKSEFALFHAKQAANLFIIDIIVAFGGGIIKGVLSAMHVPVFGSVIGLVSTAIWILNIIGLIYAAQGKKYELPVVSNIKIIK